MGTPLLFQVAGFANPPPSQPRVFNFPLPNNPAIAGAVSHWQVVMVWDLYGQATIGPFPISASPGLRVTFLP